MKQLAFFILTLLLSFSTAAQTEITTSGTRTTYQEYQFLTTTLEHSDNPSLPDGYSFKDFKDVTMDDFNFNYKLYIEDATEKVKAISIVITKLKKKNDKKRYLCIPFNNNDLFEKFIKDSEKLGVSMALKHDAMSKFLLSVLFDYIYNTLK